MKTKTRMRMMATKKRKKQRRTEKEKLIKAKKIRGLSQITLNCLKGEGKRIKTKRDFTKTMMKMKKMMKMM